MNTSLCSGRAGFPGFWEIAGLPALRNYEEAECSFHLARALSFHFRWCWGWGTLYDTQAENSRKVAPGDPPPDPRVSLMRACLWKFEVGPLPEAAAAAARSLPLTLGAAARAPRPDAGPAPHAPAEGTGTVADPAVRARPPPTQGVWARSPPAPLQVRLPLPTELCLGFRGVCSPQVCLFFFKLQMQGKPPDIMRAGQTLTLKDSWAGLQVKSYA